MVRWCAPATTPTPSYNSRPVLLSTSDADEAGRTTPIELPEQHEHHEEHGQPGQQSGPSTEQASNNAPPHAPAQPHDDGEAAFDEPPDAEQHSPPAAVASPVDRGLEFSGVPVAYPAPGGDTATPRSAAVGASGEDVVYVPLAITIGDGFKFGCGFFLAFVLAALVAFVLLAALFLLTSLAGVNLPISR